MAVICLDAGTTMIKAVGYDEQGAELASARRNVPVSRPRPGWAEQDMTAVREAGFEAVAEVASSLGQEIDFLAITAQGDGSWLVGPDGAPTGRAILWNDGRGADILTGWTREGILEEAFTVNGSLTSSGMPNVILRWLYENDPARLELSSASLTCGGWLFSQLTGETVVDESDASAPFMDIRTRRYSEDLLRLYGMDWAQRLLPPIRDDNDRTAPLTPAAAARLGLPVGLPVVLSPYDIASTAIGVGAVLPGQACSILGTTLCTEIISDSVQISRPAAGLNIAPGLPGRFLRSFPTLAGGDVIQWACGMLGLQTAAQLTELAAQCPAGGGGLVFLPYLSPAGERAPFLDPQARGTFLGLSLDHGREHLARAVLEGLSLVVRDCLTASGGAPTELRVCGGGAASDTWLQLIADVTGIPVLRSADAEVGAKGAFLIGLTATGRARSVEEAAASYVRIRERFFPAAAPAAFYAGFYDSFLTLRSVSAQAWPQLAALRRTTSTGAAQAPESPVGTSEAPKPAAGGLL
jgi:erythritol kinase